MADEPVLWHTGAEPRSWSLPAEPGPEVTAVRDRNNQIWTRKDDPLPWHLMRGYALIQRSNWQGLMRHEGPLTDASAEVPS